MANPRAFLGFPSLPLSQGRTLLADDLFAAYFGPGSPSRRFRAALGEVSRANAAQDFLSTSKNDPDQHFDAERLGQGRTRLVEALRETVVAARALDHTLARQRLGAALHALQVRTEFGYWSEGFFPASLPVPQMVLLSPFSRRDWGTA